MDKRKCFNCEKEFPLNELERAKTERGMKFICKGCIEDLGLKSAKEYLDELRANMLKPKEMVKRISKSVIGQEEAMKSLSVEFYKHFLRITSTGNTNIKKNNILLLGPTASGKSYMVEKFAEELNLPFAFIDITTVTPAGYSGGDINSVLLSLIKNAQSVFLAEKGVVFIDEIDKIMEHNVTDTVDVRGKMLQQSLLKILEGDTIELTEQVAPGITFKTPIDTSNILFICAGAFVGIEDIVRKRLSINERKIGFQSEITINNDENKNKDDNYFRSLIKPEDLIEYGFIPEIIGRLPVILKLNKLTVEQLVDVLNAKDGVIEEYTNLFNALGKKIKFTEDTLNILANITYKSKIGARGLRGILAKVTEDIFYNIGNYRKKEIVINASNVKDALNDIYFKELSSEEIESITITN